MTTETVVTGRNPFFYDEGYMVNARLSEDRIGKVIFEHAARISGEADISRLLVLYADMARDLVGADRCTLWLRDDSHKQLWTKVAHGIDEIRIPEGSGIVGACIVNNREIIVNDVAKDRRFLGSVDESSGYHTESILVVPLRAEGAVIGALQALNKPFGFSPSDAELLAFLATYSAAKIHAERLRKEQEQSLVLRRELDLAREVQRNLLPHDVALVSGLDYAGYCRPAHVVGGDYYDFLDLRDGEFSFTIGDVSGKGVPAAVLMASIQTLLRSQLTRQPLPLSTVFNELNSTIYRCSTLDRYSTLFGCLLNAERTQMSFVNAGHLPPVIFDCEGAMIRPTFTNLPIGLVPEVTFREETLELRRGHLIVCCSDGVSEAMDRNGQMWDETGEAIERLVASHCDFSASDIVQAIVSEVDRHAAGADQNDDLTVVAVRVR